MSQYEKLRKAIDDIPVLDTHEEIYCLKTKRFEEWLSKGVDLVDALKGVWLFTAFDFPEGKSDFATLSANLKRIRGHGHLRVLVRAIKDIYDVDISSFDEVALKKASKVISESYCQRDWTKKMLKDQGIDFVILELTPTYDLWGGTFDREIFAASLKVDMFMYGYNREATTWMGESPYRFADMLGVQIASFDDYLSFIDLIFRKAREDGFVAVKSKIAYERGLRFDEVEEQEAKNVFNRPSNELSKAEIKKFGDFIMHYVIQRASEVGFPIQIHTGMSYEKAYEDSNPLRLANLLIKYPETKFALFHGGYPWTSEIASLVFCHRNVCADLCWLPMISQTSAERLVAELIETTGGVRITWGGDAGIGEGACGALAIAKDVVARVLTRYVERGYLSYEDAMNIANNIFSENAREIYSIQTL